MGISNDWMLGIKGDKDKVEDIIGWMRSHVQFGDFFRYILDQELGRHDCQEGLEVMWGRIWDPCNSPWDDEAIHELEGELEKRRTVEPLPAGFYFMPVMAFARIGDDPEDHDEHFNWAGYSINWCYCVAGDDGNSVPIHWAALRMQPTDRLEEATDMIEKELKRRKT
jgi:hypothetical protein